MKRMIIILLTATYIAAWPAWMLGAVCRIGTAGLLVVMGIGYAAWIGKNYLEWRWQHDHARGYHGVWPGNRPDQD